MTPLTSPGFRSGDGQNSFQNNRVSVRISECITDTDDILRSQSQLYDGVSSRPRVSDFMWDRETPSKRLETVGIPSDT